MIDRSSFLGLVRSNLVDALVHLRRSKAHAWVTLLLIGSVGVSNCTVPEPTKREFRTEKSAEAEADDQGADGAGSDPTNNQSDAKQQPDDSLGKSEDDPGASSSGTSTIGTGDQEASGLAWGPDYELSSNADAESRSRYHKVVWNDKGESMLLWRQEEQASDGERHFLLARMSADGRSWGSYVRVDTSTTYGVNAIDGAMDESGNAIAVWQEVDGPSRKILSAYYDAKAKEWQAPKEVERIYGYQFRVITNPRTNQFWLVYASGVLPRISIKVTQFDLASGAFAPGKVIAEKDSVLDLAPTIAFNPLGQGAIAFHRYASTYPEYQTFVAFINNTEVAVPIEVSDQSNYSSVVMAKSNPDVAIKDIGLAVLSNGAVAVSWDVPREDFAENQPEKLLKQELWLRTFSAGEHVPSEPKLLTEKDSHGAYPEFAVNSEMAMFAWREASSSGQQKIRVARVKAKDLSLEVFDDFDKTGAASSWYPSIIVDGAGEFLLSFVRAEGSNYYLANSMSFDGQTGQWSLRQLISQGNYHGDASFPMLYPLSGGQAVAGVIWRQSIFIESAPNHVLKGAILSKTP